MKTDKTTTAANSWLAECALRELREKRQRVRGILDAPRLLELDEERALVDELSRLNATIARREQEVRVHRQTTRAL